MNTMLGAIEQIVDQNKYMTLATATEHGVPWISPLYYAYDHNFNVYWSSAKTAKHSLLLQQNPNVSIAIYNQKRRVNQVWRCVYYTGKAHEVTVDEFPTALSTYYRRGHPILTEDAAHPLYAKDFLGNSPRRLYRFIPDEAYILQPPIIKNGHIFDHRIAVSLKTTQRHV